MNELSEELGKALSAHHIREQILKKGFLSIVETAKRRDNADKYFRFGFLQGIEDPSFIFSNSDVARKIQEELSPDWEQSLSDLEGSFNNLEIFHTICNATRKGIQQLLGKDTKTNT